MARNSDQLLKANLKLQIRNTEEEFYLAADKADKAIDLAEELEQKLVHLEDKLRKLEKKSGKRQAKK